MKIKHSDITLERGQYGQWIASAMVNGFLMCFQYYFYTKREARSIAYTEFNRED